MDLFNKAPHTLTGDDNIILRPIISDNTTIQFMPLTFALGDSSMDTEHEQD